MAVGTTLVSSRDLLEDGLRGKGVMIFHVYLDLLWFVFKNKTCMILNLILTETLRLFFIETDNILILIQIPCTICLQSCFTLYGAVCTICSCIPLHMLQT